MLEILFNTFLSYLIQPPPSAPGDAARGTERPKAPWVAPTAQAMKVFWLLILLQAPGPDFMANSSKHHQLPLQDAGREIGDLHQGACFREEHSELWLAMAVLSICSSVDHPPLGTSSTLNSPSRGDHPSFVTSKLFA